MKTKLVNLLIKASVVNELDVIESGKYEGSNTVEKLLALGYGNEKDVVNIIQNKLLISVIEDSDLDSVTIKTLEYLPVELIERYHFVPFKLEDNKVHIAMFDPTDEEALKAIKNFTDKRVIPYGARATKLASALNNYFNLSLPDTFKYGHKNELKIATNGKKPPLPNVKGSVTHDDVTEVDAVGLEDEGAPVVPDFDEVITAITNVKNKKEEPKEEKLEKVEKKEEIKENKTEDLSAINLASSSDEVIKAVKKELKKISEKGAILFRKDNRLIAEDGFGMDFLSLSTKLNEDSIFKNAFDTKETIYESKEKGRIKEENVTSNVSVISPSVLMDEVFAILYVKDSNKPLKVKEISLAMSKKFDEMLNEL